MTTTTTSFNNVKAHQRFNARDSRWEKRGDDLGADLVDRHGNISYMTGKRLTEKFSDEEEVQVAVG